MVTNVFDLTVCTHKPARIRFAGMAIYVDGQWYTNNSEFSDNSKPTYFMADADKAVSCPFLYKLDKQHFFVSKSELLGEINVEKGDEEHGYAI